MAIDVTVPTANFTEDSPAPLSGIVITDVDTTISATATFSVTLGVLSATDAGGVSVSGSGSSTLVLSGTIDDINAFVAAAGVNYAPAANDDATRILTVTVDDLMGGTDIANGDLVIAAVNDAPVVSVPGGAITVTEDVPTALTGISFSDADAGSASMTATFSAPTGLLSAISGLGVVVGGTAEALTLTGSAGNINNFIASGNLTYTTAANATADVVLTVSINDGGGAGSGGALSDSNTVTLQVSAVNDAPTIQAPPSLTLSPGSGQTITGIHFSDVDVGNGEMLAQFSFDSGSVLASLQGDGGTPVSVSIDTSLGMLFLAGTLTEINDFIAGGHLHLDTPIGTDADLTLNVSIHDTGFSGSGGPLGATTALPIHVGTPNAPHAGGVTIDGDLEQGATLTALHTLTDPDGMGVVSYQWQADGEDIDGATDVDFVLTQDEVGKAVTVIASFQDGLGAIETAVSPATGPITNVNDEPTGGVAISGAAQLGRLLTADTSHLADLDGLGLFTYEWCADDDVVGTGATLALGSEMLGKSITLTVRYQDDFGANEEVSSDPVTVTAAPSPPSEPPRTVETVVIGGRTITFETFIGPNGLEHRSIDLPPSSSSAQAPIQIPLFDNPGALVLTLPSGLGLLASGLTAPASLPSLGSLISQANPELPEDVIQGLIGRLGQSAGFFTDVLLPSGPFQPVAPVLFNGDPSSLLAMTLHGIGGVTDGFDGADLPNFELNYLDFVALVGSARLTGGLGQNFVVADAARQYIVLGEGDDELHGGGGADTIGSAGGNDGLFGDDGKDTVFGGEGDDQAFGGQGGDTVQGNVGADLVHGNQGNDLLYGGQGDDIVRGGQGNDMAFGDLGNDLVFGDLGNDTLHGGEGADTLSGGQGDDVLSGGAGADVFRLAAGEGLDRVTDFTAADQVVLAQGVAFTLRQEGADTVIDLGDEGRMTLTGVQLGLLPEGWLTVA
ncbi:MAG TPA: hypothetical protein VIP08_19155 [Phenylobacterium sp.]|uniref:hypothetical protein n=1 Tax=Phenylobacterium sp. TaxID=1871053 RepID=UPI002F95D9D4